MAGYVAATLSAQIAVYTVTVVLSSVSVGARVWVKLRMLGTFANEDWLMLVSLALFAVVVGIHSRISFLGMGLHQEDIDAAKLPDIYELFIIGQGFYVLCTISIKLSIMTLLLRLFHLILWARYLIIGTAVMYTMYSGAFGIFVFVQCGSMSNYLDLAVHPSHAHPTCVSRAVVENLTVVMCVLSLVSDAVYAILPICLIWNLTMDIKSKIGVALVLGLGLTTVGLSLARLRFMLEGLDDYTYRSVPLVITSVLEIGIGMTVANLSSLRPLLRLFVQEFNTILSSIGFTKPSTYSDSNVTASEHSRRGSRMGFIRRVSSLQRELMQTSASPPDFSGDDGYKAHATVAVKQAVPTMTTIRSTSPCIVVDQSYTVSVAEFTGGRANETESQSMDGGDMQEWQRIMQSTESRSLELARRIKNSVDSSDTIDLPEYLV